MKNFYLFIIAFVFIGNPLICRGQDQKLPVPGYEYINMAAHLRLNVWAWDMPAFSNYTVPEEYAGESAVILAHHRQINASGKKSGGLGSLYFTGSYGAELVYTDIDRKMIKINDQAALDYFSEYSFTEEGRYGYGRTDSTFTIIGARIIKPDGSVSEVNVSNAAVSITEGKKDKEAYKKLAIPELQKGDILDIFICNIYQLQSYNMPIQTLRFYSVDYPAMNYSCELVFNKNLTVEYRSINDAPALTRDIDTEGNVIMKAETEEVVRINDIKNTRWISPLRSLPMIRFTVMRDAPKSLKLKSARPVGVHENVPYESIIEDSKWHLAFQGPLLVYLYDTRIKVQETVDNYKIAHPGLSSEELANVIYAALSFEWDGGGFQNSRTFILLLEKLFKQNMIDCKIGFTTNRYDARKDEMICDYDLEIILIANNDTQFYFPQSSILMVPGEIPSGFQGETVLAFPLNKISASKIDLGEQTIITIPESGMDDNVSSTNMKVSILTEDNYKVAIDRHSIWTGALKDPIQSHLFLYQDWDIPMRNYLNITESFMDELNQKRRTRKLKDQITGIFEKNKEEYDERLKEEIFTYHTDKPQEVKNYALIDLGVTRDDPNLEYIIAYVMDGFVRTAGQNIILDAGKLIGTQWNPTDNERNRNIDAYIPTTRILENKVSITIPDGYEPGNIDHLNMNYSNEYASFDAKAFIDGNKIIIKAKKIYSKAFIPVNDWSKLIDIIDKTNIFYSSSIVFQKTID